MMANTPKEDTMTNDDTQTENTQDFKFWKITDPTVIERIRRKINQATDPDLAAEQIAEEILGLLPHMLDDSDPRDAVTQINAGYAHGGGWHDFEGFKLGMRGHGYTLEYTEDPPLFEVARYMHGEELVVLFPYSWVAVIQKTPKDGKPDFRTARID